MVKTMTEEPLMLVRPHIGDPRAMWKALFDRYQRQGSQEQMTLEDRLDKVQLRGSRDHDLEQFFAIFEKRLMEYELAGGVMSEERKVQKLLRNLPSDYDQCRDNILDKPEAEITIGMAKTSLRRKQMRLAEKRGNTEGNEKKQEKAMNAKSWKKKIKCYNCQKMGHFANECRSKKKERKPR
jgi:hypothetical protein